MRYLPEHGHGCAAYEWMLAHAEAGNHVIIMPDIEMPDGTGAATYVLPLTTTMDHWDRMAALWDARAATRARALIGLTVGAHIAAMKVGAK